MSTLTVYIDGIGCWAPGMVGWDGLLAVLDGTVADAANGAQRPAATSLPAAERRRAPASVLLACEVAEQACAAAACDGAELPCVFASSHGDLAINDYMCATLASAPLELSPTRFHNSVHNAPAGYWTIARGCRAPSTAISAHDGSFAAGLFEAAIEARADDRRVLLSAYDVPASGPLADTVDSTALFGAALVLAPQRSERSVACLQLRHVEHAAATSPLPPALAHWAGAHATAANALVLLSALAAHAPIAVMLPAGAGRVLAIDVQS